MLYDWGRVTSKVDSASATQRKLSEAVLVARDDAALDIVETYLDVLASERRVEAVREHIQRLDGIREMTQARGGDGYADRSELDRANLELSRAQEQLSLEKGNLQDARNQYAILVGQEPADLVEPEPMSLQRYLAASDMARVIRESPLQRKALEDANVAEAEVREAKASLLPQLNLEASALRGRSAGIRKATRWYPCASAWTPSRGFPTSAGRPPRSSAWSRRNGAPTRCSATSAGNCRTSSTTATRCAGGNSR